MKKFKSILFVNFIISCIFIIFNISIKPDIALLALPLSLIFDGIFFYFIYFRLLKKSGNKAVSVCRKMMQYQPFVHLLSFIARRAGEYGTYVWVDCITVVLWVASLVLSIFLQFMFNEKRIAKLNEGWVLSSAEKKHTGMKWVAFELLDWLDALVQAVFMVLLFQIFFLQFYKIPSESMVPELMVSDRLMVSKIASGPKFPLSEMGFPYFKKYKRGDIIVFRNPHYSSDRKSEVKSVVSELVYMLTFTTVNLNVDDDGNLKADPLVKRVTGIPGEQLMMQDGILYSRTKESDEFKPVEEDASWAAYNLYEESDSIKKYIKEYRISNKQYASLLNCEKMRNSLSLELVEDECRSIARRFNSLVGYHFSGNSESSKAWLSDSEMWELNLFRDNYDFTRRVLSVNGGLAWFNAFMTDWIDSYDKSKGLVGGNLYSDANFRLNLMIKLVTGRLVLRNTELMLADVPFSKWNDDAELITYITQAEMLHNYIYYLDRRNMPVFPANDAAGNPVYIPENCYFMMGDNRFNSLDMRHSYNEELVPLTEYDAYSVTYYSNMAPQYVNRKKILGIAFFRFWPFARKGIPGHTARK